MIRSSDPRTIISLGGSLFIPENIDVPFIRAFKDILTERIMAGERFIVIVGGGRICRRYQNAGRELAELSETDVDWIGIHVTRLNAEFMRILFGDAAYPTIVTDPSELIENDAPVIFGAGSRPGWSTDYVAVMLAQRAGSKKVINLSNTNYVYDKDPNKFEDAKAFTSLTWDEYTSFIPKEWDPGLSTPFDPIASREAKAHTLEVIIINGTKLDDVKKCLKGETFEGTVIRDYDL